MRSQGVNGPGGKGYSVVKLGEGTSAAGEPILGRRVNHGILSGSHIAHARSGGLLLSDRRLIQCERLWWIATSVRGNVADWSC